MSRPNIEFSPHAKKTLFPRAVMRIEIGAIRDGGAQVIEADLDEILDDYVMNEPTHHRKHRVLREVTFGDAIDRLTRHYPRSARRLSFTEWLRAVFTGRYRP